MKRKTIKGIYVLILIFLVFILISHCTKDDSPKLSTKEVSNITDTSAHSGGIISDDGNSEIIEKGVCWAKTANPTKDDSRTKDGTGSESFTSQISGLQPSTTYYLRAYAVNSSGTEYGNELTFTTNQHPSFPETFQFNSNTEFNYDSYGRLIGAVTTISINAAIDPDGDQLSYSWTATTGTITGNGLTATWGRGISWGTVMSGSVTIKADDGRGGTDSFTINFN